MSPTFVAIALVLSLMVVGFIGFRLGAKKGRQEAKAEAERLQQLNDVSNRLLRSHLSVDQLSEFVYEQARRSIPGDAFQLGLFVDDAYDIKLWMRDGSRLPGRRFPRGGRDGLVGWVRETGTPLLVHDFETETESLPAQPVSETENPPKSALFVPMIAENDTIGVIAVQGEAPNLFTEEHQRFLTALANQVAWFLRNAQLLERTQYRAEQLNLLIQVVGQVETIQFLPDLFQQLVKRIQEAFGYYCVSIVLYANNRLRTAASTDDKLADYDAEGGRGMIGWAASQGQTALANRVTDDPRYEHYIALPATNSEVSLPLIHEGQVLGVLDVQSEQRDAFGPEDVRLLEALASQVALAIQQARTYSVERRLRQRLEALMQVSQVVISVLEPDDLIDEVVELIADNFDYDRVRVFLRSGNRLVLTTGVGPTGVRWLIEGLAYNINDSIGLIAQVGRTGMPVLEGDVTESALYRVGPGLDDSRSELAVPIKLGGRVIGVLDIQSEAVSAFSQEDLTLMQSLADSVAVALRNATLYVNERRRRRLADTLRVIGGTLVSELDLDTVLLSILNGLSEVVDLDSAAVLLYNRNQTSLEVVATAGSRFDKAHGQRIDVSNLEVRAGESIEAALNRMYHEMFAFPPDDTWISVPLTANEGKLGYLIVEHDNPSYYNLDDTEIISAFAGQAAVGIQNARLYEDQQAEAWVTTALLRVAETVSHPVSIAEMLENIARLTSLLAGVRHCLILRWIEPSRQFAVGGHFGLSHVELARLQETPLSADSYPYLDLLTVADIPLGAGKGHQLSIPEPLDRLFGADAIMAIPLQARRTIVGLMIVDDNLSWRAGDPHLANILNGIAHHTATALETAVLQASASERERLEQELGVARRIQASFIPANPPQPPGWELCAAWRAARQVSGDFYAVSYTHL
ncbi:MAG: GAF domain-containing protein, partial [Chloroflexi bacterium]|nr:GAF domain-containing protein [Chloroflexota bacterium]